MLLDVDRALPVAQLADVEVALCAVEARRRAPSRGRCRWPPASAAGRRRPARRGWRTRSRRGTRSSTDGWASLTCRNSGSSSSRPSSSAIQARVPTLPTPDHLAGHVDELELLEQVRAGRLERVAGRRASARGARSKLVAVVLGRRAPSSGTISGGSVDDAEPAVDHVRSASRARCMLSRVRALAMPSSVRACRPCRSVTCGADARR